MYVEIENYVVVLLQNENKLLNNSVVSLENVRSKHRATRGSPTFYTPLLIFVSLKYSAVRARKKKSN